MYYFLGIVLIKMNDSFYETQNFNMEFHMVVRKTHQYTRRATEFVSYDSDQSRFILYLSLKTK